MSTLSPDKINIIEAKTSDLLSVVSDAEGNVQLPVDLGKIADSMKITLNTVVFEDPEALGYLDKNQRAIYVAKDTPPARTAFTIAHEMGHYVLHDRQEDVYWRLENINLDKQDKVEETEANWFAASLLMPKKEISKWWRMTKDVEKMSKIFGVSKTAMTFRLHYLGLM